ncbi:MAG: dihydropteridine reductase [Clostridia bacterium]|nr:dihydropteridine reductase [Clostridia bacterium]
MSEDKFDYTYSAPTEEERREAEEIRRSYAPENAKKPTENSIERLRAIDRKVKLPVRILTAVIGVIGTLMLGVGMCFAMDVFEIGNRLMPLGIVVGILGIALDVSDYFVYKAFLNARKKKYAAEILAITDRFLNVK